MEQQQMKRVRFIPYVQKICPFCGNDKARIRPNGSITCTKCKKENRGIILSKNKHGKKRLMAVI